jgi:Tfp pilus assembly protein PilX
MLKKIRIWPKATSILNNEEGAVIIAALMVLVLLTIIGIASTNVSNTEVKIATHELIHQQNLYQAEGATLIALEEMEKLFNPKEANPPGCGSEQTMIRLIRISPRRWLSIRTFGLETQQLSTKERRLR